MILNQLSLVKEKNILLTSLQEYSLMNLKTKQQQNLKKNQKIKWKI